MFTVRSGLVKLVQYLPDGSQRIVRLVKPADVTGLESLLGKPYKHDAIVMQPTEVCCLPASTIRLSATTIPNCTSSCSSAAAAGAERRRSLADRAVDRSGPRAHRASAAAPGARRPTSEFTLFGREDLGAMPA